jgi:hypothetical protein
MVSHMLTRTLLPLTLALATCACAAAPTTPDPSPARPTLACEGRLPDALTGLSPISSANLLARAQQPPGKGGVCDAQAYAVDAPLTLYRVFDASKPYTSHGAWWSLTHPGDSRDAYRADNAICPEWSPLNQLISCELRPGSVVVVGTTQSATCADGATLPQTHTLQVYVLNDTRAGISHVGACAEPSPWPPGEADANPQKQ